MKSVKPRPEGASHWNSAPTSNAKLEAYYSLVGLHDTRYDKQQKKFVPCTTDEEKHDERNLFMSTLRTILPTSFRVDRSLDPLIQQNVIKELQEFAGKEMVLEVELPRRSEAVGGIKNLLDNGGDVKQEDSADNGTKQSDTIIVKKTIKPATTIPFICSGETILGYQISVDRRTLRRNPSLEPLHNWLKVQTDCGHITRQEQVSMIPPVVLNIKEGMSVLDMCAAPGSKTCQILEIVGGLNNNELQPKGYVVANDADSKRAYMLVNQLRRMNNPAVFVTSCDGQYFPILDAKSVKGTDQEGSFDRVLCDVPCSGDGTVRKNPGIWRQWNHLGSLGLHPLQLSIALRGARLTHVGGYLVYSTCSMNPMENESVVAELLRITDGALVLEDPRPRMEGLIARPGWSSWRVLREDKSRTRRAQKNLKNKNNPKMMAKRKEYEERERAEKGEAPTPKESEAKEVGETKEYTPSPYDTNPYVPPPTWDYESLSERTTSLGFVEYACYNDVEEDWRRRVRPACFPPTEEEAKKFELHHCLRCLPQDMDTGGFFVALLKKVKPIGVANERMNARARECRYNVDETPKENTENGEKDSASEEPKMAPIVKTGQPTNKPRDCSQENFISVDPSVWPDIEEEYGLASTYPKDQLMCRASADAKVVYFISEGVKRGLIDKGIQDRLTVINSGLKAFERCKMNDKASPGAYRLTQEGIHYIVPHMTKRILIADMEDFGKCIDEGFIKFETFSEPFRQKLKDLTHGSFVVALKGFEKDIVKKMFLIMWRRADVVNCFVTKVEKEAMVSKLRALGFILPEKEETVARKETACEEKKDEQAEDKS